MQENEGMNKLTDIMGEVAEKYGLSIIVQVADLKNENMLTGVFGYMEPSLADSMVSSMCETMDEFIENEFPHKSAFPTTVSQTIH